MDRAAAQEGTRGFEVVHGMTPPDVTALSTADFSLEHISGTPDNLALIGSFRAAENADGLERYLKEGALRDEVSNESRTYLVKDSVTGELACYFSLRTCLVPISLAKDLFTTVPAIELANFAVNEAYRTRQRNVQKIGAYAFLNFVLPLSRHSASIVGARWLCVYALPRKRLLTYYGEKLGFARLAPEFEAFVHSRIKPEYDQGCIFMYQELQSGAR